MIQRFVAAAAVLTLFGCNILGGDAELFPGDSTLTKTSSTSIAISTADSKPYIVDVPSDASSFAVVLQGLGETLAQPAKITNPNGEVVWEVGVTPTNRADAYAQVQTTQVPITPDVAVVPGEWEFVFFGNGTANASAEAVFRLSAAGGELDVNLYFVGLELLDASSANAELQAALAEVKEILAPAGIRLGEVSHHDVDDAQFTVLTTNAVGSHELLQMLRKHTTHDNRAVNIFLVADIEDPTSSASLLGVSGSIPGSIIPNLARSGIAINMANFLAAQEAGDATPAVAELATVIAHEIGHHLGLYHTVEANGQALAGNLHGEDPIRDTVTCQDSADSNGDGILTAAECGDSNLMFWSPNNGARTLTAGQRHVIARSPLVR